MAAFNDPQEGRYIFPPHAAVEVPQVGEFGQSVRKYACEGLVMPERRGCATHTCLEGHGEDVPSRDEDT